MKKLYKNLKFLAIAALFGSNSASAQCIGAVNYASATLGGTTTSNQYISGCTYEGERNTLNVTFIGGAYTFYSSAPYMTIYDVNTSAVVAFGPPPLTNVIFPATGQYYLQLNSSGPPNCGTMSNCNFTEWSCDPLCSTSPVAGGAVASPSLACPNIGSLLNISGGSSGGGLAYQWYQSTTGLAGTWSSIPNATMATYPTPLPLADMHYYATIACPYITGTTATTTPAQVIVAGTTTNTVPYYENFESISVNNELPNCSWAQNGAYAQTYTGPNTGYRQPRSGNKFGAFYAQGGSPSTDYLFSNGIFLNAGITYSASVWYMTEPYGYTNISLNMSVGQSQTSTGLTTIASATPAASGIYKELANTFTVANSGMYYIAIEATSDGNWGAEYLSWDDLSVTIPCSLNSPTLSLNTSTTMICEGESVTFNVSGADTYTWNTGSNLSTLTEYPTTYTVYSVTGSSDLSGCGVTLTETISVNPAPDIIAFSDKPMVCSGSSANLSAAGNAVSYIWNVGIGSFVTVSLTTQTSYTVVGTGANGCTSNAVVTVGTYSLPVVAATSSKSGDICAGESVSFSATGATSYQWTSDLSSVLYAGNPINVALGSTAVFTVTGTNSNGCVAKGTVTQIVQECVGLSEVAKASGFNLYPNPTSGIVTVELNTTSEKTIQVVDVTGRIVAVQTSKDQKINTDLSTLAAGIYYIKIQTAEFSEIVKVVKQ